MPLTFQDEQTVRTIVREEISQEVKEQLTDFRSGVFEKLDQVIGELKAISEEQTVTSHALATHQDRIEVLEKQKHSLVAKN